jgi:hypothetical protein
MGVIIAKTAPRTNKISIAIVVAPERFIIPGS